MEKCSTRQGIVHESRRWILVAANVPGSAASRPGAARVPDLPDQRDFLYSAPVENMAALPTSMDLRL
jgi:hypothetical protein